MKTQSVNFPPNFTNLRSCNLQSSIDLIPFIPSPSGLPPPASSATMVPGTRGCGRLTRGTSRGGTAIRKARCVLSGPRAGPGAGTTTSEYVLYDSKDLTTHALCVGMTGSGKTGLCISLLEEAGIDGIPAIVVDPKGDIGNLLLTFPDLRRRTFGPGWMRPKRPGRAVARRSMPSTWRSSGRQVWPNGVRMASGSGVFGRRSIWRSTRRAAVPGCR